MKGNPGEERRKRGVWHLELDGGIMRVFSECQQECVFTWQKSGAARKKALDTETHTIPAWFMKHADTRHAFLCVSGTHGKGQAEAGAFSMSCTTKQGIHQTNSHTQTDVSSVHTAARWTTQH